MKILVEKKEVSECKVDCLILGHFEDKALSPEIKEIDSKLNGAISDLDHNGEAKDIKCVTTLGNVKAKKVMVVGLGKTKDLSLDVLQRCVGKAVKKARCCGSKTVATTLHNIAIKNANVREKAHAVAEAVTLALYDFNEYITVDREKIKKISSVTLLCSKGEKQIETGAETGLKVATATNYTRDLVNIPPNIVTPTYLAHEASKLAKKYGLKVTVYGEPELKKMGMNGILNVSKGSREPPKLIVLEKKGKGRLLSLVGKGITFDSGGLGIKPWNYMLDMKMDMAGAATVLGTMQAICELGLNANVVGILPACENMTGGFAYKPGDIFKSYNGKTIEIWHTDAEGRLILADALAYAEDKFKPSAIIDLATLTGSVMMALGYEAAGLWGNDDALVNKIKKAADASGDKVWHMPLYDKYKQWIKAEIADVRNMSKAPKGGGEAGCGTAAAFLAEFVEGKWAHLDIAGSAYYYEDEDYISKGPTGHGVRLMTNLVKGWR